MKHEQINNFNKDDNNPFDLLTEAPKNFQKGPQLDDGQVNALLGSLKSKLAKRDLYQNTLPKEYFDEIEQTIKSLEERQASAQREKQDSEPNKL